MSGISVFPLIVLFFLLSSAFFSVKGCPAHERKALLRFRSSLNDTDGMLDSWTGDECCTWRGVKCDGTREGRHVSKLDLRSFFLQSVSGEIDSALFEFKHLNYLDLSGNYFYGEIPSQLENLSSLRHLDLSSYIYAFSLRSSNVHWLSNLSSLEYLSLRYVNVSDKNWGSIMGSLLHLKHLDLSECSLLSSFIPRALLNLSSLTYLNLRGNSLSHMHTWIGELFSLTHLDFSSNYISGSISNTIGTLTGLEYLNLSNNALTGKIPFSLGNGSLSHLDLGLNQLTGNIPASLGNLHKLRNLYLDNNQLSGSLPLSVFHLPSLTHLDVSDNGLNGNIPSALMLPSSLQELYMSNNNMNGTITEVFLQRSLKLEVLDLSHSGLSVNFSSTWIPSFQLKTLLLKKCQIEGPILSWISTQFFLVRLDLSANQLMGNLPSWLWDIEEVRLSDNNLQGSFTPTSGSSRYLDLSMNELSGRLPTDIHIHLSNAEVLILANNKFEGKIATSMANLTNLFFLDMSGNYLSGNVPVTLGNFTSLVVLHLENNYLVGEIPRELGGLSYLMSLRLGKNRLQGVLPSSLRNLSDLQVLDVGENNLTGNISHYDWICNFSSLYVLVMRQNNFQGILPPAIGKMPKLQLLDFSSNFLSGTIPHSYLRFPAMQNSSAYRGPLLISDKYGNYSSSIDLIVKGQKWAYQYIFSDLRGIDLSNNRLTGHLSPAIENVKGLMYLNLSMNSLSGPISESLGNLVQLESLDLSFNKFSGRIPWQLGDITYLAHLNLSHNNLIGMIPQQGQMLTFDESSYIGNTNLWGCPLESFCSRPGSSPPVGPRASPPAAVGEEENPEEDFEISWYVVCLGLSVGVGFAGVIMMFVFKPLWRIKCFDVMDRVIQVVDRVICMQPKPRRKPKLLWG